MKGRDTNSNDAEERVGVTGVKQRPKHMSHIILLPTFPDSQLQPGPDALQDPLCLQHSPVV